MIEAPQEPKLHAALGLCLLQAEHPAAAIEPLTAATQLDPTAIECLQHLALAHLATGDITEAAGALQWALHLNPENGAVLLNLGQLFKQTGDHGAAEDFLKRALVHLHGDPQPLAELADLYLQQQDLAQAPAFAKASWQLHPNNPNALRTLTTASHHSGDPRRAIRYGELLVSLAPGDPVHHTLLGRAEDAFALVAPLVQERRQVKPDALVTYGVLADKFGQGRQALKLLELAVEHPSVPSAQRPQWRSRRASCTTRPRRTIERSHGFASPTS